MGLKESIKKRLQKRINDNNRKRLRNKTPTLVCSNCTGGFLYSWLGLEFRSPFINLYMSPADFITALEHFDEFMQADICELTDSQYSYPVGVGAHGTYIHFMHYDTFAEAITAWNRRKARMNMDNMGIMLSSWSGDTSLLARFEQLPFKHKVVFTDAEYPSIKSAFWLKGYRDGKVYATQKLTGQRYIDQFDYVDWINHLEE